MSFVISVLVVPVSLAMPWVRNGFVYAAWRYRIGD